MATFDKTESLRTQIKMTSYICEELLIRKDRPLRPQSFTSQLHYLVFHSVNFLSHCFAQLLLCWTTTLWYYVESLALAWRWLIFCLLSIIPMLTAGTKDAEGNLQLRMSSHSEKSSLMSCMKTHCSHHVTVFQWPSRLESDESLKIVKDHARLVLRSLFFLSFLGFEDPTNH